MDQWLENLLSISGPALGPGVPVMRRRILDLLEPEGCRLLELLGRRNGFFAFESALHVFAAEYGNPGIELNRWNDPEGWRKEYDVLADSLVVFFAHDAFGVQFGLVKGKVVSFEPEVAKTSDVGASLERWAQRLLEAPNAMTGHQLAHEWQVQNGPLPPTKRLVPKIPFILGGKYAVSNLMAMDAEESLGFRAEIYRQTKDLPDGAKVEIRIKA